MGKKIDPAMHSAEHILNRTMDLLFESGRCFRAHIEKKKSKCDYRFHRALTADEVQKIESRVNAVIQSGLAVSEAFLTRKAAKRAYNLDRLPDDAGETVRIVNIGSYDACPCIGPHVNRTEDIGRFRITTTSFDNGVLRIRFKLHREGATG